jgi:hypothetical protein
MIYKFLRDLSDKRSGRTPRNSNIKDEWRSRNSWLAMDFRNYSTPFLLRTSHLTFVLAPHRYWKASPQSS